MLLGRMAVAALLLVSAMGHAQEREGTATGYLVTDQGNRIELHHARARRVDDAAHGNPDQRRIEVLLTERPIAPEIFEDRSDTTLDTLARQGGARGLLITIDPAERNGFGYTELEPLSQDRGSLLFGSTSSSEGVWDRLEIGGPRASGAYSSTDPQRRRPQAEFTFDAPITEDRLERILTGAEASRSELVPLAIAQLEQTLATLPPEQADFRPMLTNLMPLVRTPLRIVLRRNTAELLAGEENSVFTFRFARENGRWRVLPAG